METIFCNRTRCHVCGFTEIRIDEAVDRELVVLAECPRCNHRWTDSAYPPRNPVRVGVPARAYREVASAA